MKEFHIGDRIRFINASGDGTLASYMSESQGVPIDLVRHGKAVCDMVNGEFAGTVIAEFIKTHPNIKDQGHKFYVVAFPGISNDGFRLMQLGFKDSDLELIESANWTFKISYESKDGLQKRVVKQASSEDKAISEIEDFKELIFSIKE